MKCDKGFELKEGKCIKSQSSDSSDSKVRKSYYPFKMLGPWIGVLVSLAYFMLSTKMKWFDARDIILKLGFSLDSITGGFILGTVIQIIIGFLVGWLVHSIIRWIKK